MRRKALTASMLLFGALLIVGGIVSILPTTILPVDQYLGTHASIAATALGIGICVAGVNPMEHLSWVRIAIIYALLAIAYELGAHFAFGLPLQPVPLGVAAFFAVLLILLYPFRDELLPRGKLHPSHARLLAEDAPTS